jgi:REP element-mobilizing transposase RayT
MSTILDNKKHHRRSIRLKDYDYSQAGAYFVTICVKDMKCILGKIQSSKMRLSKIGGIIQQYWEEIPNHFDSVKLDVFVVMPNHLHGIVYITDDCRGVQLNAPTKNAPNFYSSISPGRKTLSVVIRTFKAAVTTHCRKSRIHSSLWQRNYYEHIIRNEEKLDLIRGYILYNPLQWQYDRENPEHVQDNAYHNQWHYVEKMLYNGASENNNQRIRTGKDACSTKF